MTRKKIFFVLAVLFCASLQCLQARDFEYSSHISNTDVSSFAQDKDGYIWIGTKKGLNRFNGSDYTVFYAGGGEGQLANDNIMALYAGRDGKLWIGTECGLIWYEDGAFTSANAPVYNPSTWVGELDNGTIVGMGKDGFISFDKENMEVKSRFRENGTFWLRNILVSSESEIWYTMEHGDTVSLCILDHDLQPLLRKDIGKDVTVTGICEMPSRTIWVSTSEGLQCFDGRTRNSVNLPEELAKAVSGRKLHFIVPYLENSILIGIAGRGFLTYNSTYRSINQPVPEQRLTEDSYTCFADREGNIWLSDHSSEISFYSANRTYTHIEPWGSATSGGHDEITHLCFDNEGYLWYQAGGGIRSLDTKSGEILWSSPAGMSLGPMLIDASGKLWGIDKQDKLIRFRLRSGKAFQELSIPVASDVFALAEDKTGQIWLCLSRRLGSGGSGGKIEYVEPLKYIPYNMMHSDPATRRIFLFTVKDGLYELMPEGTAVRIPEDGLRDANYVIATRDGALWCGTYNKGLLFFDEKTGTFLSFSEADGMIGSDVKSILEDRHENIWFSTSSNICKLDARYRTFSTLHDDNFSGGRSYSLFSAASGPDGKLYFGGTGGITAIDPELSLARSGNIPFRIESLEAGGLEVSPSSSSLTLSHRQNSLTIRFAGLDFESGSLLNYAWRLEGREREWNYSSKVPEAVYSYLPAGNYTFRARVRKSDGSWNGSEISLPVRIKPAPLSSPLALCLYILFALGMLIAGVWTAIRIRTQRYRIAASEQKEELKQQHIDFITNVSHEFRTPLSMIFAPAKELAKSDLSEKDRKLVETIERNSEQLRKLSEQILNSTGSRSEREQLTIRENDLAATVRLITTNFQYPAGEKNISLTTDLPESCICFFDTEKVSKIIGNLVSNAVKYTPEGGRVVVSMECDGRQARITVADNGIGIPEEKRSRIFDRFDRLGAEKDRPSGSGSGIGLNFAKSLSVLHKGVLDYRPNKPEGSVFFLNIPVSREAYESEGIQAADPVPDYPEISYGDNKEGVMLIAEDNAEVRNFLCGMFAGSFHVIPSSDGSTAIDNLKLTTPDIVLSDIMMPNVNGYALCREIKENENWRHVPVVLLTAKADAESNVKGMRCGADAYVSKPFDPDVLRATVASLIENRRRLQERILNMTSLSSQGPAEVQEDTDMSPGEKKMLEKLHKIIDEHLENEEFNVQELASEMAMSYSSLYQKVKALTGKTPQQFVSTYRMNIAMELLKDSSLSIGDVAFKVGSSSPFTFSREFKKHFGYPPSQARQKKTIEDTAKKNED